MLKREEKLEEKRREERKRAILDKEAYSKPRKEPDGSIAVHYESHPTAEN